jgi:hypothetical protein
MKPEGHGEIYRVAFDTAHSELADISAEFDRLLARKQQLENLVLVLQSVIPDAPVPIAAPAAQQSTESPETDVETSEEASSEAQPFNADPFQRRIDHVLGIGAGIRDVRKYSRQF